MRMKTKTKCELGLNFKNMLKKLKPANKAKAEKMLEKSPEGMFQLLDVAFGGK